MPEMGGDKAFDLIREIQPAMPVILSSGYSLNDQATAIMRRGCNDFIQKPFTISALSLKNWSEKYWMRSISSQQYHRR
jgi:two-component system cell cycle sensor histidine kinase/response regulator CckA